MGLFNQRTNKNNDDSYNSDDYLTDFLEGAVLGALTSVLICNLLDDGDDEDD